MPRISRTHLNTHILRLPWNINHPSMLPSISAQQLIQLTQFSGYSSQQFSIEEVSHPSITRWPIDSRNRNTPTCDPPPFSSSIRIEFSHVCPVPSPFNCAAIVHQDVREHAGQTWERLKNENKCTARIVIRRSVFAWLGIHTARPSINNERRDCLDAKIGQQRSRTFLMSHARGKIIICSWLVRGFTWEWPFVFRKNAKSSKSLKRVLNLPVSSWQKIMVEKSALALFKELWRSESKNQNRRYQNCPFAWLLLFLNLRLFFSQTFICQGYRRST